MKSRRYFAGEIPVAALNVRMKCAWSKKPVSCAISVMRRSVVARSVFAALSRVCRGFEGQTIMVWLKWWG